MKMAVLTLKSGGKIYLRESQIDKIWVERPVHARHLITVVQEINKTTHACVSIKLADVTEVSAK
jgi:hypothetical protein